MSNQCIPDCVPMPGLLSVKDEVVFATALNVRCERRNAIVVYRNMGYNTHSGKAANTDGL